MVQNNVLIIDQGESILVNLTHFLDRREISLNEKSFIFSARTVEDAQTVLKKSTPDDRWKVIVIGREGETEPRAQQQVDEIRAAFGAANIPILLVTRTSPGFEAALKGALKDKASVARIDPDVNFDLADVMLAEGTVPKEAEVKFDRLIKWTLKNWLLTAPESAASYPLTPETPKVSGGWFRFSKK